MRARGRADWRAAWSRPPRASPAPAAGDTRARSREGPPSSLHSPRTWHPRARSLMTTVQRDERFDHRDKRLFHNGLVDIFSGLQLPHSITSSALASTSGGIARPSAFAVLRLITSSYLVGACTGRSAGFSPLR